MTWRLLLTVLVLANVVTALAVVHARHQHRQLFVQATRLEKARDELNIEFGRLQLELHRAIRLVVDSGIHHKRWSREQAIKYVEDNSADAKGGIVKAIERYIVYPGQATAYMVGKLKIEELRGRAKAELGAKYDDRGFHDTILLAGSMPLSMLEKRVDGWIAKVKGS